jgi:uncharacterized protein
MKIFVHAALLGVLATSAHAQDRLPVIDMHLHAQAAEAQGPPPLGMCTPMADPWPAWDPATSYLAAFMVIFKEPACGDPIWSPMTDEEVLARTIAVMERNNVYGVLSGAQDRVTAWMEAAPGRFVPGYAPGLTEDPVDGAARIRDLHADGRVAALAELGPRYAADHERLASYWAVAEELDIPVGIHIGPGPPGMIYMGSSASRARLHSAFILEEVLVKHPALRVFIMHAGYPLLEDLLAVLYAHPHVYVEVGIIVFGFPRASFYRYLQGIVEAGFANRVMFGSDQMVWPEVIERSIAVIEEAPFLSEEQKRDILYNNAARFLRLTEEEIARHHGR